MDSTIGYVILVLVFLAFIGYVIYHFSSSSESGSGSETGGDGGAYEAAAATTWYTDPETLTISKITDKIIKFSSRLNFEVVNSRSELNMFLWEGGSVIAQKRGTKIPLSDPSTKEIDLTTFTLVDGSGYKFTGLTEGVRYYIQFIFASSDPQLEDKEYSYEFLAPRRIQFGHDTTVQLPIDGSKGQLSWTWVVKDKNMIAKYRRVSSNIPWFGGVATFEDDILSIIPSTVTYMLVKPGELYYRLSDQKLVDVFDNETETKDDITGTSITMYAT
jgi:hypothetical protein